MACCALAAHDAATLTRKSSQTARHTCQRDMNLLWGRLIDHFGQGWLVEGQIIAACGIAVVKGDCLWFLWLVPKKIIDLKMT